jgi:hypothetical protein
LEEWGRARLLEEIPLKYLADGSAAVGYSPRSRFAAAVVPPRRMATALESVASSSGSSFGSAAPGLARLSLDFEGEVPGIGWEAMGPKPPAFVWHDDELPTGLPGATSWRPPHSGLWMQGDTATLALPLKTSVPLMFEALVTNAVTPDMLASLRLTANGRPLQLESQRPAGGGMEYRALLPVDVLAQAGKEETVLRFSIDRAVSPQEVGMANDTRRLGLYFDEVRVHAVSE